MKNVALLLIGIFTCINAICQSDTLAYRERGRYYRHKGPKNDRISVIVGPGASYVTRKLYQTPAFHPLDGRVILQEASKIKTSLSVGLVYTPYSYSIINSYSGKLDTGYSIRGISYAAFFNPIALSKITENQGFFNTLDFGIGIGYRASGEVLILGTVEFFNVRQPRDWFINEFKNNDKKYQIGNSVQNSISIDNNDVYTNKSVITFGFKVCYTFKIIKDLKDKSSELK